RPDRFPAAPPKRKRRPAFAGRRFSGLKTSLLRHGDLTEAEELRLAGVVVDAVIVGDGVAVAGGVDGEALDLVEDIAVGRLQERQQVVEVLLGDLRQVAAERGRRDAV